MSHQLRAELRLWHAKQSQAWLKRGLKRPDLVFPSNVGTPFDDANVRKVFTVLVKKADLRHRNLHAMRHTFISLLLQNGESRPTCKSWPGTSRWISRSTSTGTHAGRESERR
jgi:integrase